MTPADRWKLISALYHEALTYPAAGRAAFVSRACEGDDAVRQELESLLDCHDEAQHTLDSSAADVLIHDIATHAVSLIGRQLGAYRIDAALAAGGMGEVYQATDTRLHRRVAIKMLPQPLRHDPSLRERFEREAQAVAALRHPHVCVLYDIGCADGIDFLVMELLEGQTIANRLLRGPLPFPEVVAYAIEIGEALVAIHRQGMVHRDLKPSNVMLTDTGAKLLDFGLARGRHVEHPALPGSHNPDNRIDTATAGTLCYMAPEQVRGQDFDHRADIFAFGALVFEMLAGRKVFDGATPRAVAAAVLEGTPVALSGVPQPLESLLLRCLEKNPEQRWQTADEMLGSLRAVVQRPVDEVPPAPSHRLANWVVAATIAIAITVALVVPRSRLGESRAPAEVAESVATQPAPPSATQPSLATPRTNEVAATPEPETVSATANVRVGRPDSADSSSDGVFAAPTLPPSNRLFGNPMMWMALPAFLSRAGWLAEALQSGAGGIWLHLSVIDGKNLHVPGLGAESVTVLEDGVVRPITYFSNRQPPLAVSLVLDTNTGTSVEFATVVQAVKEFVRGLGPADLAQIVTYSDRIAVTPLFTNRPAELERVIRMEPAGGSTSMRNALYIALQQHRKLRADVPDPLRRGAIIVYSSTDDDASFVSEEEVIALARRTDAAVHVLATAASPKTRRDMPMLRALTSDTGGEVLVVSSADDVSAAYAGIAKDLASQYLLAYDSPNPADAASAREVTVQISRSDFLARTRRVYYPPVTR